MKQIYIIEDFDLNLDEDFDIRAFSNIETLKTFLREYNYTKSFEVDDELLLFIKNKDYQDIIYNKDLILEEQAEWGIEPANEIDFGFAILCSSLGINPIEVNVLNVYEDVIECEKDIAYDKAKRVAEEKMEEMKDGFNKLKENASETFNRLQEDERVKEATKKFEDLYSKAIDTVNQALKSKEEEIVVQYLAVENKYVITKGSETLLVFDKKNDKVEFENTFAIEKLTEKEKTEFNLVKDIFVK